MKRNGRLHRFVAWLICATMVFAYIPPVGADVASDGEAQKAQLTATETVAQTETVVETETETVKETESVEETKTETVEETETETAEETKTETAEETKTETAEGTQTETDEGTQTGTIVETEDTEEIEVDGGISLFAVGDTGEGCPHPNIKYSYAHVGPRTIDKQGDASGHIVKQDYRHSAMCEDCGSVLFDLETVEIAGDLFKESHHFPDNSNICRDCGYERVDPATCEHKTTHWEEKYETKGRPVMVDGQYHEYPNGEWANREICDVCNKMLSYNVICQDTGREQHEYNDGVCGCGAVECSHTDSDRVAATLEKVTYAPLNYNQHTKLTSEWAVLKCADCGTILSYEQTKENAEFTENHSFSSDGVCALCGQTACTHENEVVTTELTNRRDYKQVEGGEKHSFIADVTTTKTCPDCGNESTETVTGQPQEESHKLDESGKCALCGYCDHRSKTVTQTPIRDTDVYTDNQDGKTHIHFWNVHRLVVCPNCGTLEDVDVAEPESEQEDHTFANGYCIHCDAACTHTDGFEYEGKRFDWRNSQVTSYNDVIHVISVNMVANKRCITCGKTVEYNAVVEENVQLTELHEFGDDGYCLLDGCGAQNSCQHNGTTHIESFEDYEGQVYATCVDDQYHSIPGFKVTQTICDLCGAVLEETREDAEVLEEHHIRNGVCTFPGCGYEGEGCKHENQRKETDEILQRNQKSLGHDEHEYYVDVTEVVTCEDCGEILSRKTTQTGVRKVEEHIFMQGVCAYCGEKEPEPTPTPTPTPTPAPTAEPTVAPTQEPDPDFEPTSRPNRTPVPTVKPVVTAVPTAVPTIAPTAEPTKKPIVETLFEAVTEAEAEGKDVEVEIVGTQEVMTQEEYTELKTLSAQEQVLVTLKSAGLDEVVQAAVTAMNVKVSNEASSLMDKVGTRVEKMTAEEKTAYEDKLAEYFPVTERVMGGVTVRTFTIDMKIVVDGYERVERYQFYLDENGEWVFEKVDLASFGKV